MKENVVDEFPFCGASLAGMTATPPLFEQESLSNALDFHRRTAAEKIESIPVGQFLNTPIDDLIAHITNQFKYKPLALSEDRITQRAHEVKRDLREDIVGGHPGPCVVHATRIIVLLPFTGDRQLWGMAPGTRISGYGPHGFVAPGEQVLQMAFDHPVYEPQERLKEEIDRNLHLVREYVRFQNAELEKYHRELPEYTLAKINERRERLAKQSQLTSYLAIPLAPEPGSPAFKPLPLQSRIVHPLPPPPKSGYQPEPGITDHDYENILSILRHVGRTFEATPKTYHIHDEEELRDILLAHLNGHYKGLATGETFRRAGKTDIRIETENRAAFIAECKFWSGQKTVTESINQLLDYLTWRDCKTAVILFNKDVAGFNQLLTKVQPTVEAYARFMKTVTASPEGEWHFVLRSKDEDARLVYVHVFLLNIYFKANASDC